MSAAQKVQHCIKSMEFFINFNNAQKAVLEYRKLKGGTTLDLYHTFVPPELRGQKIGDKLCQEAFNYCKENHLKVVTSYPFVQKYANETATDEERKLVVKKLGDVHVDHKE